MRERFRHRAAIEKVLVEMGVNDEEIARITPSTRVEDICGDSAYGLNFMIEMGIPVHNLISGGRLTNEGVRALRAIGERYWVQARAEELIKTGDVYSLLTFIDVERAAEYFHLVRHREKNAVGSAR